MYETTKSESTYKFLRHLNILLALVFLAAVIVKVIIFPTGIDGVGFKIFTAIVLSLFMVPYLLCARAFKPQRKARKTAIVVSVIWCVLIVVGVTSMQQGLFVNTICALFFVISAINIFFLVKISGLEKIKS